MLTSIKSPGGVSRSFYWDSYGRITNRIDKIPGGTTFSNSCTYDNKGRLSTITHPSAIVETRNYNSNGYLSSISANGVVKYTISSMNAFQQVVSVFYGSGLDGTSTSFGYDNYGYPTQTVTTKQDGTKIQDYSYNFDPVKGILN